MDMIKGVVGIYTKDTTVASLLISLILRTWGTIK
jgi:hypothetical protein